MLRDRRRFLADIGCGMFAASVGSGLAIELGLSSAHALEASVRLEFGELEPLVALMQETSLDSLQRTLVEKFHSGTTLEQLVAAGALANARSFGGQDYNGYHTFMALAPALEMSKQLPVNQQPLPVLKVLYRNTARIQEHGGRDAEVLRELHADDHVSPPGAEELQAATRSADFTHAESVFAQIATGPANEAFNHLQFAIQDEVDVHRTVLAWRAWKMIDITGEQHAHTLLRQSVRYCVDAEQSMQRRGDSPSDIRKLLPELLEDLQLMARQPGNRRASEAEIQTLSGTIFEGTRADAARAMATALADGLSIESAGEALSLAANQLLLCDPGRSEHQASSDKPVGSVHGASVGVHACDSANAWRNIARVGNARNQFASMIVGAYHTAGQQGRVGTREIPYAEAAAEEKAPVSDFLGLLEDAVRDRDQLRASALTYRYLQAQRKPIDALRTLLQFAVSEEGALHAEKFYRTVSEEFAATRPSLAWRHIVALARVSASEYGFPAAGIQEARELLRLTG